MSARVYLGSLTFYLGYFCALLVSGLVFVPISLLLRGSQRQWLITRYNAFVLFWLKITCGIRYQVEGLDQIPQQQACVFLSNHQSEWETIYFQLVTRPLCTVLKKELLRIPVFGWGLAALNPIAVDRSQRTNAMKQVLVQGKARLQAGYSVLIFPEGTRLAPQQAGRLNKGGAALAVSVGVPVIPVVHNAGEHWLTQSWLKTPGCIRVRFGAPIATKDRKTEEVHQEVVAWMQTHKAQVSDHPMQTDTQA